MADLRRGVKWLLFLSSYIPLFIILAIKHRNVIFTIPTTGYPLLDVVSGFEFPILSVFWVLLAAVSAIILKFVFDIRRSKGADDTHDIGEHRSRDDLITNYVLVYIFPFVVLDYTMLDNWLVFLLFLFVIGIIQVKSNHLYVNPILSFFDYRIYEADTDDGRIMLLTKGELEDTSVPIPTVELSNDVHITI